MSVIFDIAVRLSKNPLAFNSSKPGKCLILSKLKCCNHYAHQNCVKEWYNLNPTKKECFICKNNF